MFVNFSNHCSELWSNRQLTEARKYGEIIDYPFPMVDPNDSEENIKEMANRISEEIGAMKPDIVMCQGEFTLCYNVVKLLKDRGIKVVAASSERKAMEEVLVDETVNKISVFEFVKFREY